MFTFSLTEHQKKMFGEKILDLAHLVAGGFVIGQFISEKKFSLPLALAGVCLLVLFYWASYTLTKKRKK
jgi:hypothetical protein